MEVFEIIQRVQNNVFYTNKTLNIRGKLIDLCTPRVMGILNITPDSFYDGGKFNDSDSIHHHVKKMLDEGADFIDVGGVFFEAGELPIFQRTRNCHVFSPVIESIRKNFPLAILSIDTFRSEVAKKSIAAGASIINDISGGELDPLMFQTVAAMKVPYIIMHMRGTPQNMSTLTQYDDLIKDITSYFQKKILQLHALGVTDIIIDPGFGFAKTTEQNFEVLKHLEYFKILGQPVLAGPFKKVNDLEDP